MILRSPCSLLLALSLTACGSAPAGDPQPGTADAPAADAPDPWRTDPAAVIDGFLGASGLEPVEVLLLGTFHFADQGLDAYQPTHSFDPLAPDRQAQIERVVEQLAAFRPDVVCVERRPDRQEHVDARYARFRNGELRDDANEITQIAFRLADRVGLERVHAIDAQGRWLEPRVDPIAWAREQGRLADLATPLEPVFGRYLAEQDRFIDRAGLAAILRYLNHPAVTEASHGVYLVGGFHAGDGTAFPGADGFVTQWFNRNLRIFANLARVTAPGQRAIVLIGAGHVPILRHCVRASPEFELVEVADVIAP